MDSFLRLRHNSALMPTGSGPSDMAQDPTPFLRAFASLTSQGDHHAAPQAASDACRAAPHLVWPHCAYGQAWLGMDVPARAEQAFATAVRIAPGWADAWIN
jgi:hypothetical protein